MQLPPLTRATILKRYKRFLADVELENGELVVAHCPNTGSMRSCWEPGAAVELSHSDNPKRKLAWTLERVDMGAGWVGVNTHRVNSVVEEGARQGRIPWLETLKEVRREVRILDGEHSGTRLDLLLTDGKQRAYVEVKNVTLLEGDRLLFPDAVSLRALKHLQVLEMLVGQGYRAMILFALNRPEGQAFAPAVAIHPEYAKALSRAQERGVEAIALRLNHGRKSITVGAPVPLAL